MMGVGAKRALGLYRSCAPRQRKATSTGSMDFCNARQLLKGKGDVSRRSVAEKLRSYQAPRHANR